MAIRAEVAVSVLAMALAFSNVACGQDVRSYSRQEAEAALSDVAGSEAAGDSQRQESDEDGASRGFSIARRQPSANGGATNPTHTASNRVNVKTSRYAPSANGRISTINRTVPLQFNLGSFALSPQSRVNLQTMASVLNEPANSGKHILITGHTDKSGSAQANVRLSQQRAEAVVDYLAQQGVDRTRLDAQGRGFEAPLPATSLFDPRNRRVEIIRVK